MEKENIWDIPRQLNEKINFLESSLAYAKEEIERLRVLSKHKRWVCPQCFSSIRPQINAYKEKPGNKCPNHFNLEYIEIGEVQQFLKGKE